MSKRLIKKKNLTKNKHFYFNLTDQAIKYCLLIFIVIYTPFKNFITIISGLKSAPDYKLHQPILWKKHKCVQMQAIPD